MRITRLWNELLWRLYEHACRRAQMRGRIALGYRLWRQMHGVPIRYPQECDVGF